MDKRKSQTIRLVVMLVLTFSFFIVELVVGYITDSLALISDSYHMLSDTIALIIGLTCVRISYWSSPKNTYGWVRAEVLGALINAVFLIALCFTILTDGITRLITPQEIHNVDLLLYVGIAGLAINVFGLIMFCSDTQGGHHGHSHGGGGGGGDGGHGHSHGVGKKGKEDGHGHSHDSPGNGHGHSHGAGNGDAHSPVDSDSDHGYDSVKADTNGVHPKKAIGWLPPPTSDVTNIEDNDAVYDNNAIRQVTLTIDADYEVENQTTIQVCEEEDEDEVDTISVYSKKGGLVKSGSQMNMIGVFLHVFGDALGSVVVIVSALVIKFVPYDWVYRLDPAMSIIMAIIILSTTIPLFKESAMVLLQTVPTHIKVSELQEKLLNKVNGITGLHEFHVWQLTGKRIVASGHIRVDNLTDYTKVAHKVKTFFHDEGIHSTTFQPEFTEETPGEESTEEMKRDCALECGPDKTCFENTCCSNKLKKNKKNAIDGSRSGSIDMEAQTTTNQAFDMVDETSTSCPNREGTPSNEGTDHEKTKTCGVEMYEFSTNI